MMAGATSHRGREKRMGRLHVACNAPAKRDCGCVTARPRHVGVARRFPTFASSRTTTRLPSFTRDCLRYTRFCLDELQARHAADGVRGLGATGSTPASSKDLGETECKHGIHETALDAGQPPLSPSLTLGARVIPLQRDYVRATTPRLMLPCTTASDGRHCRRRVSARHSSKVETAAHTVGGSCRGRV
jgi:hypothetical protein